MVSKADKERIFVERLQHNNPHLWARYCELVSHETMSKDELDAYNFSKRRELVKWAYKNTEFYHSLYSSSGFDPADLKSDAEWEKLPIVTKQMLKDHLQEMCVRGGGFLSYMHIKQHLAVLRVSLYRSMLTSENMHI